MWGDGTKAAGHVYKMAPVVTSPTQKLSRRIFVHCSFRSIVDQNTLLKTEQEIFPGKLEWKETSFKVLRVTMSPRYIWPWTTKNRSAAARMHETNYLQIRHTLFNQGINCIFTAVTFPGTLSLINFIRS